MNDTHFVVAIRNKIPVLISGPPCIVTDNTDYMLELLPDSEWDEFPAKTVYYAYDTGDAVVHPITGNIDAIPIVRGGQAVHIGISAGNLHTSQSLALKVVPSIRRRAFASIPEPEPLLYDRLMEMINNHESRIRRIELGGGGSGGGVAFEPGNALELVGGVLGVTTADTAEPGNTLPITSGAVYDIAAAVGRLSEEKADKEFVINIFEQLKALIESGKTDEAIAVLDEAILDLAVLA